jgi:hypothetical protein
MNPMQFMIEGGFGMWPVLVFGLFAIGGAGRYAWQPLARRLPFVGGMILTTASAVLHATWTALGSVFRYLESPERASDADFVRVLVEGLKESTRPGALGGMLITLALLVVCIGLHRARWTDASS